MKQRLQYLAQVLALGSVFVFGSFLSETYAQEQSPRLVDSYGVITGSSEAEMARLDNLDLEIRKAANSNIYTVGYNGSDDPPGKARRYVLRAKTYLERVRGVATNRIVAVEGGRSADFTVELWLVPPGASAPPLTPTITESNDLGDNLLYDEFGPGYDNFASYEGTDGRLDGFAAILKTEPTAWACIIAYAQSGDDKQGIEWDSSGTAKQIANEHKNYMVKAYGFAPWRVTAVDGGYSRGRSVELWIMRPGARFDKGPFVYPHRLKVRQNGIVTIDNRSRGDVCCRACVRGKAQPNNY